MRLQYAGLASILVVLYGCQPESGSQAGASGQSAAPNPDAMQLAKKNNCYACHSIDKKVVGPSFRDVAAKYRGDAGAEAKLAEKIAKGGSGSWGVMPMPPFPLISEEDRKTLARYALALK